MNHSRRNSSGGANSALALVLIAIFAMPILGVYLLGSKNETDKLWGTILTTGGIILWIVLGIIGAS